MSRVNKIIYGLLTAFQFLCVAGAVWLDDLSRSKVGVNHHVVYKKRQYMQTLLDSNHMLMYGILLGILLTVMVLYLARHRERETWIALLPLVLLTLAVGLFMVLPAAIAMPAYVYLLLLLVIIWGLEAAKVIMKLYRARR